jgi:hypothetical protein
MYDVAGRTLSPRAPTGGLGRAQTMTLRTRQRSNVWAGLSMFHP